MKHLKYFSTGLALSALLLFIPIVTVGAHSETTTQDATTTAASSLSDEQKGHDLYEQLQDKQTSCDKLTDDDFANLGDFFMVRMMGDAHDSMDQYMTQNLGAADDRQTHIVMGERLSGCDTDAAYPSSASNYAPMAWTGMSGSSAGDWNMMGYGNSSWSESDMALTALFVIMAIAGLLAWLYYRNRKSTNSLEVLKLRLAKGEITKNEFERLKNEIGDK